MAAAKGKVGVFREWIRKCRLKRALRLIDKDQEALRVALGLRGKHFARNPKRKVKG